MKKIIIFNSVLVVFLVLTLDFAKPDCAGACSPPHPRLPIKVPQNFVIEQITKVDNQTQTQKVIYRNNSDDLPDQFKDLAECIVTARTGNDGLNLSCPNQTDIVQIIHLEKTSDER